MQYLVYSKYLSTHIIVYTHVGRPLRAPARTKRLWAYIIVTAGFDGVHFEVHEHAVARAAQDSRSFVMKARRSLGQTTTVKLQRHFKHHQNTTSGLAGWQTFKERRARHIQSSGGVQPIGEPLIRDHARSCGRPARMRVQLSPIKTCRKLCLKSGLHIGLGKSFDKETYVSLALTE